MNPYKAAFLSKHRKELWVGPVLSRAGLQVHCVKDFDTDRLGTFSGEVERPAGQAETAVMKARKALELCRDASWGLGSEGAFNPHPSSPFITLNTEILALCARDTPACIMGRSASAAVTFAQREISNDEELKAFALSQGFPAYGIILKVTKGGRIVASEKECITLEHLFKARQELARTYPDEKVLAETDLRAHRNPRRQAVITEAAEDLLKRWTTFCPECEQRGFGREESIPGLPCGFCHFPTRMPKAYVWRCPHCRYEETRKDAEMPQEADPSVCSICNP